jgi:NADH:ubiquinone oxidoreductase subunit 5 (subunit L)/multisubunit Na+/H+ antiporter MnhA subunit
LLNEFDIKKLIAYSTMRHVSLIIYLLRVKLYKIVYFHLNIHAIFKSLIFMCFGFVILSSFHRQDKRLVLFLNVNPLIKIIFYFSCLCLAGLPFLRGFFSKDLIIEKFIEFNSEFFYVFLLLLFLRISIYYRIKLIKLRQLMFSFIIVEKRFIGIFSVFLMGVVIILIINLYISLVFRVTLEILHFKVVVYLFIRVFFLLRLFRNLSYKFFNYEKTKNFIET